KKDFLLISARERPRPLLRTLGADVESSDESSRRRLRAEREIVGDGHVRDDAVPCPILRDVRRSPARQRVTKIRGDFGLAVSSDAYDRDDLARRDGEVTELERRLCSGRL